MIEINFSLFFSAVIEDKENYVGCVNISAPLSAPRRMILKAHEAAPSKCIEKCRTFHWAFIQDKNCTCSNDNSTVRKVNEMKCSVRCLSNSSLICGGKQTFSAYKTGKRFLCLINFRKTSGYFPFNICHIFSSCFKRLNDKLKCIKDQHAPQW